MSKSSPMKSKPERPTERPTRWIIGICQGCGVQHGPHVKDCVYSRLKWFPVELIQVERVSS